MQWILLLYNGLSYLRHDYRRFEKGLLESWQTKGSIFNYKNENIFNKEWQEKFDEKAYFPNTLNAILLTEGYLKSKGCKFYFTSIGKLETLGTDIPTKQDMEKIYVIS